MPSPLRSVVCAHCGSDFTTRPKGRPLARFCSKRCVALGSPERLAWFAEVGRLNGERSGDEQRGKGEGKSYRKFRGRHLHRVVAERKIGRQLLPGEVVHHIDGDKLNNHPDNLEVLSQAEHMRRHGLGLPGVALRHEPWKFRGKKERTNAAV